MAFDAVRLPVEVERRATGGPGFLTSVSVLSSGREQRNQLWEVDRGRWDVGYGVQTREDALVVRDFFFARRGRARGFLFKDWSNYRTEGSDRHPTRSLTATTFQLTFEYPLGDPAAYVKDIFKPVAGTVSVYEDGVELTTGVSVNAATGVVTVTPAPSGTVTWSGEFDLPVRFDTDQLEIVVEAVGVLLIPSVPIVELKQ